jgi:hypothetical protein
MLMPKTKLIAVSQANYDSLRKWGLFRDSFDDVITKILNKVDSMPNSNFDNDELREKESERLARPSTTDTRDQSPKANSESDSYNG